MLHLVLLQASPLIAQTRKPSPESIMLPGQPEQPALLPEKSCDSDLDLPGPRAGRSLLGLPRGPSVPQNTNPLENSPNPAAEQAPLSPTLTSLHPAR